MLRLRKRREAEVRLDDKNIVKHTTIRKTIRWNSKNGKSTLLKEMDDNHIHNIIRGMEIGTVSRDLQFERLFKDEIFYRTIKKQRNEQRSRREQEKIDKEDAIWDIEVGTGLGKGKFGERKKESDKSVWGEALELGDDDDEWNPGSF